MLGTKVSHGYRHADSLPGKPVQVHSLGDLDSTAVLSAVWRCCSLSSNVRICRETPLPTMGSKDFKALLRSCRAASLSSGETSSFALLCLWQALSRRKLAGKTVQRTQICQVEKNPQSGEIKDKASGGTLSAHSHQDPVMSASIRRMSSKELSGELRETLGWPQVSPASAGAVGPG